MRDLIALYTELSKLPERVVGAFLLADIEPPHRDTVDRIGYTARQRTILHKHLPDPILDHLAL